MSIINEALKKAQKDIPPQSSGRNVEVEFEKKSSGINWGPIFVLLVIVLVGAPILAPVFSIPFQRSGASIQDARQIPAGAHHPPAAASALAGTRQGQFGVEEMATGGAMNAAVAGSVFYPRPDLALTGLVYSSSGDSYCIINGRVVKVGETVDGAKLIKVEPQEVILDFRGEQISIPVTEE